MNWVPLKFKHMSMEDRLKQVALHKLMGHEIKELGHIGTECKNCHTIWMPEIKELSR